MNSYENEKKWDEISPQVAVFHGNKKLVEILNFMNPPTKNFPSHLYADGDEENGKKVTSKMRIQIVDYSNKGNNVVAHYNMEPDDVAYFFQCIKFRTANIKREKIFGDNVTKLSIGFFATDNDGKPRNYPWFIGIENGKAESAKSSTGGTYIKPGTYKAEKKMSIFLSDADMYKLFWRASMCVEKFILTGAPLGKKYEGKNEEQVQAPEPQPQTPPTAQAPTTPTTSTQNPASTQQEKAYALTTCSNPIALNNYPGGYKMAGKINETNEPCEIIFQKDFVDKFVAAGIWTQMMENGETGLSFTIKGMKYNGPVTQILVTAL